MGIILKYLGLPGIVGAVVSVVLGTLLGVQVLKTHSEHASAVKWEGKYNGEHAAFTQTIINYAAAAEKARIDDAANQQRVELEHAAIGRKTEASYEARIAAARALADRLRHDTLTSASQGGGSVAPVPGVSAAPGGTPEAAGQDGLSQSDKLIATEQAIQLDELIKWLYGVHGVNVNGHTTPTDQDTHPELRP